MRAFFDGEQQAATIPVLDGLRALACLAVVTFHVNWTTYHQQLWQPQDFPIASALLLAGGTGVTLFFVLSGFLLFLPYARALLADEQGWPSARRFYLRRAFRILPAYYVSLALLVFFWQPAYLQPQHWRDLLLFVTFFMDSTPETFRKINGPYWTLAVEWQFYLLLPLLALGGYLLVRRVPQRSRFPAIGACLGGLMVWALLVRCWGDYYVSHPGETLLVPRTVLNVALFFLHGMAGKFLEDFAIGMLLATCYAYGRMRAWQSRLVSWLQRYSLPLGGAGIALLCFMALWHLDQDLHTFPWLDVLAPAYSSLSELGFALGYGACMAALLFGPAYLRRPLEWRYVRWVGAISYSLYIWHLVLIALFEEYTQSWMSGLDGRLAYGLYWLWVIVAVIPLAGLSYALIERPFMRLGSRLTAQRPGGPSGPEPLSGGNQRSGRERGAASQAERQAVEYESGGDHTRPALR